MKNFILAIAAFLLITPAAALATSVPNPHDDHKKSMDIVDTAASAKVFGTLIAAVQAAGLESALRADGPLTVFAPTDDAFNKLPEGTVAKLLKPENKDMLIGILKYHVVAGNVMASDVVKLDNAKTIQGDNVMIKVKDGSVYLNGSTKVTKTDIKASNGTIHIIDSVLMPPMKKDIVDTAVSTNMFNTLVAAVKAAGLVDTLKGSGPFTVLAPTDEAFAKLPAGTVENLLKPENKDMLVKILTYHVIPGDVRAETVKTLKSAKTVQGQEVKIKTKYGKLKINGATVIKADVEASNGVIHVIDTVLMPK
ncbi:MAG: fasciclin domain-containing protein [Acidobacteriota bacterium]|nr:fasciclin domain-containing protein [Acidobacteriota bacterium]MDH3529205.1 fasciclin domain-containing protein [Acidobacteriota bacterium]